jgi:C2H2 transcription facotor
MDFTAQHPPYVGQAFFYYHPDPSSDTRQHGQFTTHPQVVQYQHAQFVGENAAFERPASAPHASMYAQSQMLTPAQSPQPLVQKPVLTLSDHTAAMLSLDTDCYMPTTPPLSSAASTIDSPPSSCDLITPINASFALEGVKAGCEGDVLAENLAGGDFWSLASPPLSPGKK